MIVYSDQNIYKSSSFNHIPDISPKDFVERASKSSATTTTTPPLKEFLNSENIQFLNSLNLKVKKHVENKHG